MTLPLDEIYQEVILDHNRKPRNFGTLADPTHSSHGTNPLCGDDYRLYLRVGPDDTISDIAFQGSGCAISKASASIMAQMLKGRDAGFAQDLKTRFIELVTRDCVAGIRDPKVLGSLVAFQGVRRFPIRVKCATLIWHTLEAALNGRES